MADDPLKRSIDSLTAQLRKRRHRLDRFLLALLVLAIIWGRYGFDAILTFVVLPLCILGIFKAISEVIVTRSRDGNGAAAQAFSDRFARIALCGLVGVMIVARIHSPDDDPPPPDPCLGLSGQSDPACQPSTTAPTTTHTPNYVPTTVTEPGRQVDPTCPPERNRERRLSFTATPPFCLNRDRDYLATVETNYGSFEIDLNMCGAPWTVNNFAFLAGWNFYDGVTLTAPDPFYLATSLFVGDPVAESDTDDAPGYGLTFDRPNASYPESSYLVMLDSDHPNRFEVAISRERREEIESDPSNYPLLGEIINGEDSITQSVAGDRGPRFTNEAIVIESVTIGEVLPSPDDTTTTTGPESRCAPA